MGPDQKCTLVTLCLLFGACGEAKNDFFDDDTATGGTAIPSTQSATPSAGGSETNLTGATSASTGTGGSDAGGSDAGGSDAGGSTSGSTAANAETDAAASDTTSSGGAATSTTTSTTGAANDPECPDAAPEATTFCDGMIGLSCSYDDVTCVCSGLTWNCMGGETTSSGTGNSMGAGFGANGAANGFGMGGTFND